MITSKTNPILGAGAANVKRDWQSVGFQGSEVAEAYPALYTVDAPFFAFFAKGGSRECMCKWIEQGAGAREVTNPSSNKSKITGSIAAHACKKRKAPCVESFVQG
jgi:hypothetical protein